MKASNIPAPVWYMGGLAVAGVVAYYLIKKGAGTAAVALNPANPDNIINTGFNAALESVGVIDKGSSLGSQIYDWFHPEYDPNAPAAPIVQTADSGPGFWDKVSSWLSSAALGGAAPAPAPPPAKPATAATYLGGINTAIDPLSATSFSWLN